MFLPKFHAGKMVIPVDIGDGDLVLGVLFLLSGGIYR